MNKNKLITVRIEAEKRDQFKKWVKKQKLDVSEFLTIVIEACLDGRIDENLITNLNPQSDSTCIDKLNNRISELTNNLDKRIDKIEEQVNELVTRLDNNIDKRIDKEKEKVDDQQETKNEQLTHAELARRMNVSPATISRWANGKRQLPLDLEWRYNSQLKKWVK
ncbi:MAG: helix-turn-helix domain-containing protein [Crocosphaera sp.]